MTNPADKGESLASLVLKLGVALLDLAWAVVVRKFMRITVTTMWKTLALVALFAALVLLAASGIQLADALMMAG